MKVSNQKVFLAIALLFVISNLYSCIYIHVACNLRRSNNDHRYDTWTPDKLAVRTHALTFSDVLYSLTTHIRNDIREMTHSMIFASFSRLLEAKSTENSTS